MYSINIEAFWVCLLGFWLSYSLATFGICRTRLHWFVKFSVIAGLAGLLYFIKAPDLMLIVLAQCLTIFLMLKAGEFWRARKGSVGNSNFEKMPVTRPQIGLLDVMLGMAVFGVLLTATRVDLTDFFPLVFCVSFGVLLGVVVVLAWWSAKVKRRWIGALIVIACICGAIMIPRFIFPPPEKFNSIGDALNSMFDSILGGSFIWGELVYFVISILIANAIAIFLVGVVTRCSWSDRIGIKRAARLTGVLMIATMVVLTAATVHLYVRLLSRPQVVWPVERQSDEINGFDELVAAGNRFKESGLLSDPEAASAQAGPILKQELNKFSNEFKQVEVALQRPVLTAALSDVNEYDLLFEKVQVQRAIARALSCRAIQHLHEDDADAALADTCLMSELSEPMRRSKLLYVELTAGAIEGMGDYRAVECIEKASSESLKQAISRLAGVMPTDQSIDEVLEHDDAIWWSYCNWLGRLFVLTDEGKDGRVRSVMQYAQRRRAFRRQTVTLMAIELFRREEKRYPIDLESLVPTFFDSLPVDPFSPTGKPLRYLLNEDGSSFELYSIGPDLVDNRGKLGQFGFVSAGDEGDMNLKAEIKYENATTDAERDALTIPDPWGEVD